MTKPVCRLPTDSTYRKIGPRTQPGAEKRAYRSKPVFTLNQRSHGTKSGKPSRTEYRPAWSWRTWPTATTPPFVMKSRHSDCAMRWASRPPQRFGRKGPPQKYKGTGRPPKLLRRDPDHQPISVEQLARALPASTFRTLCWREGTSGTLRSRFGRVRVRAAHRDYWRGQVREEEWLLIEWPDGAGEPTRYWLSTLPKSCSLRALVNQAPLRWRVERDYQELKQELGLGHYEGRGWRGFHHHATLCIAAYGFLVAERAAFSPSARTARPDFKVPRLPRGFQPRGAAGTN